MSVKVSNHIRVFVPSLELAEILKPTIHSEITERKQMSTKTMKQRIAVVAVSALTAGLFSVVSAPVANAAFITNCQIHDIVADGAAGTAVGSNGLIATNCAAAPGALLTTSEEKF